MSDSTQWHRHAPGEWHKVNQDNHTACMTKSEYKSRLRHFVKQIKKQGLGKFLRSRSEYYEMYKLRIEQEVA